VNLLLTVVRVHAGLSIHSYGAYNAGIVAAAIMLAHYVGERMAGSIRGSALSGAEVAAFVTFVWMMVQREKYVGEFWVWFLLLSLRVVAWCGLDWIADDVPVVNSPPVGANDGLYHPVQGGPIYPDRPYGGVL